MSSRVDKIAGSRAQPISSYNAQSKRHDGPATQRADDHINTAVLKDLQGMANNSSQTKQMAQLQASADNYSAQHRKSMRDEILFPTKLGPLQRKAAVFPEDIEDHRVVIRSEGEAKDYSGGSSAKNKGWNNVNKYKALAQVGKNKMLESPTLDNNFLDAHAGHILASENGGDGGDPDNVFAQDGGVNTASYREYIEIPMRKQIAKAAPNDDVKFRVSLYGDKSGEKIKQGNLEKKSDDLVRSDEDTDFDEF